MSVRRTREQRRNEAAGAVCREVRYQIAACGGIADNQRLWRLLMVWMRVSRRDRYTRPKDPGLRTWQERQEATRNFE